MDTGAELLRADLSALAQPLNESAGLLKKDAVNKKKGHVKELISRNVEQCSRSSYLAYSAAHLAAVGNV